MRLSTIKLTENKFQIKDRIQSKRILQISKIFFDSQGVKGAKNS